MQNQKPLFSGKVAFTLYDTYGFPLDLTQSILKEKGIEINVEEFNAEMAKQKEMAKKAWAGSGDIKNSKIYFEIKEKIQPTEFVGYEKNTSMGKILALIKNEKEVNEVKQGDEFEFFVDKTPFYGECGGQVGDNGLGIQIKENGVIPLPFSTVEITDVKRPFPHYFLHKAKLESGSLKVGDYLNLSINIEKRNQIKANHSATHLLQYALRLVFGDTVMQKGSTVDENRLRFDFTLNKAPTKEQLRTVENIVNELIYQNTTITTKTMKVDEAKECGAMALFGEKYEDEVRVIFMGEKPYELENKNENFDEEFHAVANELTKLNNSSLRNNCSIELCGGTHVCKTGDICLFKIMNEGAIASGIRRIEACTGLKAIEFMNKFQNIVENINAILQINIDDIENKITSIIEENKDLRKKIEETKKANLSNLTFEEENINNIKFAFNTIKDANPKDIKGAFIDIQNKKYNSNSVILSIVKFDKKLTIIIGVSKDLNNKIKANELIVDAVKVAGGNGGGGQAWFAMGGSTDDEKDETIKNIIDLVRSKLDLISK
ncbi:MAG TPA: alanine--tRNA ligase-related protein [Rickettsiales bacterium]|nr:alanine--tRNA ligase-related protein [Rickettsiales bacterium]